MNKFLIIINTHNNIDLLNITLENILSQNYQQTHYLVVICDTSTEKVERKKNNNLVYVDIKNRLNMSDNWNRSIQLSINVAKDLNFEFSFFGLFHDDDIYDKNILKIYNEKLNISTVDIITSSKYIVGKSYLYNIYYNLSYSYIISNDILYLAGNNYYNEVSKNWFNISTPSIMFSKNILKSNIKYNSLFGPAADMIYMLELSALFNILVIKDKLLGYRIHNNSTSTQTITLLKLRQEKKIFKIIKHNILEKNIDKLNDLISLRKIMFFVTIEFRLKKLIRLFKIIAYRLLSSRKKILLVIQIIKIIIKIIKAKW
jgi:hypothetical protein